VSWKYRQQTVFNTGASDKVTGTTRLKVRVRNPAASRLDESSGKALNADHDNQAGLRNLKASTHFPLEIVRDRRLKG